MVKRWVPIIATWMMVLVGQTAWAHGVNVDYRITPAAVELEATFDNDQPLANAQVIIYAPDQPNQPWRTTTTDAQGRLSFSPPSDQPGLWQVKVRQAGHGKILNIPINGSDRQTEPVAANNPMVRGLMGGIVMLGFVLTAILFSFKNRSKQP